MLSTTASADDPPADGQWHERVELMSTHKPGDVTYMSTLDMMRSNVEGDPSAGCTLPGPDASDYCWYNYSNGVDPMPALGATYSLSFVVAGASGAAQDARADVTLDQPFRPYQMADGTFTDLLVLINDCSSSQGGGDLGNGATYTDSYSSCLQERKTASGRSGSVSGLRATTP
jgi:hypothetical protein